MQPRIMHLNSASRDCQIQDEADSSVGKLYKNNDASQTKLDRQPQKKARYLSGPKL